MKHKYIRQPVRLAVKKHRAFTMLELLIMIGFVTVIAGLSMPMYRQYQITTATDIAATTLVQSLRNAQTFSQAGKHASPWGVYVRSASGTDLEAVVYKGASFNQAGRNTSSDITVSLGQNLSVSGLREVSFQSLSGTPQTTTIGCIVLTSSLGGGLREIAIDASGLTVVGTTQAGCPPGALTPPGCPPGVIPPFDSGCSGLSGDGCQAQGTCAAGSCPPDYVCTGVPGNQCIPTRCYSSSSTPPPPPGPPPPPPSPLLGCLGGDECKHKDKD